MGEILNEQGETFTDEKRIRCEAMQHYNMQFQVESYDAEYPLIKNIPKLISEEENMLMEKMLEETEVREVVFSLNASSASGPDDFSRDSFQ